MSPLPLSERHDAVLRWLQEQSGRLVSFRLVTPHDASFILQLRLDPDRNRHLSVVSNDLERQREWIVAYQQRELQGSEFYFIIQYQGEAVGVVRMYDFHPDSFAWGSWIILAGVSPRAALRSAALIYEIGQRVLGFNYAHFDVRKDNTSVNRFHRRTGAEVTSEDADSYHYRVDARNALRALSGND